MIGKMLDDDQALAAHSWYRYVAASSTPDTHPSPSLAHVISWNTCVPLVVPRVAGAASASAVARRRLTPATRTAERTVAVATAASPATTKDVLEQGFDCPFIAHATSGFMPSITSQRMRDRIDVSTVALDDRQLEMTINTGSGKRYVETSRS